MQIEVTKPSPLGIDTSFALNEAGNGFLVMFDFHSLALNEGLRDPHKINSAVADFASQVLLELEKNSYQLDKKPSASPLGHVPINTPIDDVLALLSTLTIKAEVSPRNKGKLVASDIGGKLDTAVDVVSRQIAREQAESDQRESAAEQELRRRAAAGRGGMSIAGGGRSDPLYEK